MTDELILSCLAKGVNFEIMEYYNDKPDFKSYEEYYEHNVRLIQNLPAAEKEWLLVLVQKIKNPGIKTVDLEYCSEHRSCGFYFNKKNQLCITTPR